MPKTYEIEINEENATAQQFADAFVLLFNVEIVNIAEGPNGHPCIFVEVDEDRMNCLHRTFKLWNMEGVGLAREVADKLDEILDTEYLECAEDGMRRKLAIGSRHRAEFKAGTESPGLYEFVVLSPSAADEDRKELVDSLLRGSESQPGIFDGWALVRWIDTGRQNIVYHGPEGWCQAYDFDESRGGDPFFMDSSIVTCQKCGEEVFEMDAFVEDEEPHDHVCKKCYKGAK